MYVDIVPIAAAAMEQEKDSKIFVVIDVFRATSTIITALDNGALEIWTVRTLEDTNSFSKDDFLFAGEQNAFKIPGFSLGNSPLEFTKEVVAGKKIVFTTSNGTKGIVTSLGADNIIICSLLNMDAVASFLVKENKEIVFVCSGTGGKFSLEDFLCAGGVINSIKRNLTDTLNLSDFAIVAMDIYRSNEGDIRGLLNKTSHYNYLVDNGFGEDVDYCIQTNISKSVAVFQNGAIKIWKN